MKKRKTRSQLKEDYLNLDFTSDFLFTNLMEKEELCKNLVELLLKIKIEKIIYQKTQYSVKITSKSRGVRFDAYLQDEKKIYDIEMQCSDYGNLPQRARYYQSIIDVNTLKTNQDFGKVKECYVIFICKNDPLGKKLPIYTIQQNVAEDPSIKYDDFSRKVFYNASGWESCKDKEIKAFLRFLSTRESDSDFTNGLKSVIKELKDNMSLLEKFMSFRERRIEREIDDMEIREEIISIGYEQGKEQGLNEGIEKGLAEVQKNKIETAKVLLKNKVPLNVIIDSTGLTEEEIEKISETNE